MRLFRRSSRLRRAFDPGDSRASSGSKNRKAWTAAMMVLLFAQVSAHKPAVDDSDKMDAKAMLDFARLGRGFLVWERFENDSWQIWSKQIDGKSEERLVPPEAGHDHFCPKISPDGALLGYMSYP